MLIKYLKVAPIKPPQPTIKTFKKGIFIIRRIGGLMDKSLNFRVVDLKEVKATPLYYFFESYRVLYCPRFESKLFKNPNSPLERGATLVAGCVAFR